MSMTNEQSTLLVLKIWYQFATKKKRKRQIKIACKSKNSRTSPIWFKVHRHTHHIRSQNCTTYTNTEKKYRKKRGKIDNKDLGLGSGSTSTTGLTLAGIPAMPAPKFWNWMPELRQGKIQALCIRFGPNSAQKMAHTASFLGFTILILWVARWERQRERERSRERSREQRGCRQRDRDRGQHRGEGRELRDERENEMFISWVIKWEESRRG